MVLVNFGSGVIKVEKDLRFVGLSSNFIDKSCKIDWVKLRYFPGEEGGLAWSRVYGYIISCKFYSLG